MKNLSNEQIMDYLDGALSPSEQAQVEAHLKEHTEDAALVREMQFALGAVKEWNLEEDLRVGENFWPALRDQLGPAPKRSLWGRMVTSLNRPAAPQANVPLARAPRWSLGAAVAAAAIGLGVLFLAPQNSQTPAVADLSPADEAFITQSLQQHEAYVESAPIAGDTDAAETGAEDDEDDSIR